MFYESLKKFFSKHKIECDISNEIASRFGVYHQSPQLLLIKEEKSVYDVFHNDIDAGELKGKL